MLFPRWKNLVRQIKKGLGDWLSQFAEEHGIIEAWDWFQGSPTAKSVAANGCFLIGLFVLDGVLNVHAARTLILIPVFAVTRTAGQQWGIGFALAASLTAATFESEASAAAIALNGLLRFGGMTVLVFMVEGMVDRIKKSTDDALHDPLTGVLNRLGIDGAADALLASCVELDETLVVVAIDLDDFKPINDLYGHAFGDRVLHTLTECLAPAAAGGGVLARVGGDEFQMLLPRLSKEAAQQALVRAGNRFSDATLVLGHRSRFSFGVAVFQEDGDSLEDLFRAADQAMYRQKSLKASAALVNRPSVEGALVNSAEHHQFLATRRLTA